MSKAMRAVKDDQAAPLAEQVEWDARSEDHPSRPSDKGCGMALLDGPF